MPQNWKTYKLKDICQKISVGFVGTISKHYTDKEEGVPILRSKNVRQGKIDLNDLEYITHSFHQKEKKSHLFPGDIVIVRVGENRGDVCKIKNDFELLNVANCVFLRPPKNLSNYIEVFLRSPLGRDLLLSISSGSAQLVLNTGSIAELEIPIPLEKEATEIAQLINTLDDKIELNLQMNKTLEEMAMALYKHWFVDFGPFKDGEFVESELGMIPKGWEVKKLGEITENISKGTTPTKKDLDGLENTIPFIKVKDLSSDGFINESNLELIPNEVHNKQLKRSILFHKDILFSIAGTIGKVALVPETLTNSNCNQALAFIRLNNQNELLTQVYYFLNHENTQEKINSSIVQGVQANVSLTVIKDLKMVIGDKETYYSFNLKIKPIFDLIQKNKIENRVLTLQRDSLLPKLISGEIILKEIR